MSIEVRGSCSSLMLASGGGGRATRRIGLSQRGASAVAILEFRTVELHLGRHALGLVTTCRLYGSASTRLKLTPIKSFVIFRRGHSLRAAFRDRAVAAAGALGGVEAICRSSPPFTLGAGCAPADRVCRPSSAFWVGHLVDIRAQHAVETAHEVPGGRHSYGAGVTRRRRVGAR